MSDFTVRNSCRLCASPELTRLLTLPDTPLANSYPRQPEGADYVEDETGTRRHYGRWEQEKFPLYLVGCNACGHVQLPVEVDPRRLFPADYAYQSGTSAVFREHLKRLADDIMCELDPTGVYSSGHARHLDIACNDGTLVKMVRANGRASFGVDPAAPDEPWAFRGFFTEEWAKERRASAGTYSVVTALNVFAHLPDMDDFTRGVKALLEPCGLFVIEVGYLADVVAKGRFSTIYHEHLAYHHLGPLVRFFRKHNMTLVDAERIESQGGSIRLFVRNHDGRHHGGGDDGTTMQSERLQALLDEESRSVLWEGVKLLGNVKAGWGVRGARDQLKARAPLVCYGAPAKLCTLLHATGQTDAVEYVVDDNPNKAGKFVPGTRIPILPVSTLYERRPKRVLVTAWNFFEEIRERNKEVGCEWHASIG